MKDTTIAVWIKKEQLADFVINVRLITDSYIYGNCTLYTEKMTGDFIQANITLEKFLLFSLHNKVHGLTSPLK